MSHRREAETRPELPCLYTQADNKMKLKLNKSGRVVYPRRSPIYILGKQRG